MRGICRKVLLFILMLGTIFMYQTVFAEENVKKQAKRDAYDLGEVTVTGKKLREPVTSRYAVPESSQLQTEVFDREDIERIKPESVLDVLQFSPGIEITYQGRRQFDFTNMRGQGSLGIVIDGAYIPPGGFTRRMLATIPVDNIESITVVRDATALTLGPLTSFGSDNGSSNQGFVVIKTKRASKLEGGISGSYGTFDTHKEHLYHGAKISGFDYRFGLTNQESQGRSGWYNAMSSQSLNFRGGYTGETFSADVFFFKVEAMREMQRAIDYDGKWSDQKWKYDPMDATLIGINLSKAWSPRQITTLGYSYNTSDFDFIRDSFKNPAKSTAPQPTEWGRTFDLRHVVSFSNNILRLGGQYLSQKTAQDMYSLYVHDEHRFFNNRLTIDGGIRADKKYYHDSPASNKRMKEWAEPVYTVAVGASYKLTSLLTATGRYAYSENTAAEYQIDSETRGSLPGEKKHRYEGGFLANLHPAFNPSITVFYYDAKNQKVSVRAMDPTHPNYPNPGTPLVTWYIDPATGEEVHFVGTSDVRTKGVELGLYGNFLKSFSYNINYSYMTTDNGAINRGQPHVTASGRIGYQYGNLQANVNVRYYGPWKESTSDGQMAKYDYGDFFNWGANVSYNTTLFNRPLKITLYGRNLGDDEFVTRYRAGLGGFPDPGRRCGIELAYDFF